MHAISAGLTAASTSSASRGVLGLDSPILVQVKSGAQVGSPVVASCMELMATHGADQGLLVAWGGLTKQAQDALRTTNSCPRLAGSRRGGRCPQTTSVSPRRSGPPCRSSEYGCFRTPDLP
jgi:hypothetical protein